MVGVVDLLEDFFSAFSAGSTSITSGSLFAAALAADFLLARLRAPFGTIAITLNPHLKTKYW
ncbi:unannotated protein [freshwater metagenome]|uniref:Unannotated protein n=1 Tax=freshwater metagenome TaxID=449393 RepID=A0A6J6GN66_9ZZZZ